MRRSWCIVLAACAGSSPTAPSERAMPPIIEAPPPAPIIETPNADAPELVTPLAVAEPPRAAPARPLPPHRDPIERAIAPATAPWSDDALALRVDADPLELDLPALAIADEPVPVHAPPRQHGATRSDRRRYGVAFDVGLPDGATTAFVYRPARALELGAGVSYNGIATGARGEIAWAPLPGAITPTVSLAVGHFGAGDANPLVRFVTGRPTFSSPLLDRVGYDYADAHVGIELRRRALAVYLRAGASRITGAVHGIGMIAGAMPIAGVDPQIAIWTVSARAGIVVNVGR